MRLTGLTLFAAFLGLSAGIPSRHNVVNCLTPTSRDTIGVPEVATDSSIQQALLGSSSNLCLEIGTKKDFVALKAGSIVLTITRTEHEEELLENCTIPFHDIHQACTSDKQFWGGSVLTEKYLYEIYIDPADQTLTDCTSTEIIRARHEKDTRAKTTKGLTTSAKRIDTRSKSSRKPKSSRKSRKTRKSKSKEKSKKKSNSKPNTVSVPSIKEIKAQFAPSRLGQAIFWSGPDSSTEGDYGERAKRWAAKKNNGYKILEQIWRKPSWPDRWTSKSIPRADRHEFFDRISKALAKICKGKVYVMLPSDTTGTDWFKGTIWDKYEWPRLQKNKRVKEVWRVNPDHDKVERIL